MEHSSLAERVIRGVLITAILVFFLFPILWIFLMSFQTNEQVLRIPPSLFFSPTTINYSSQAPGSLALVASLTAPLAGRARWTSM